MTDLDMTATQKVADKALAALARKGKRVADMTDAEFARVEAKMWAAATHSA